MTFLSRSRLWLTFRAQLWFRFFKFRLFLQQFVGRVQCALKGSLKAGRRLFFGKSGGFDGSLHGQPNNETFLLDMLALPGDEHDGAYAVQYALSSLQSYADEFNAAVELFNSAQQQHMAEFAASRRASRLSAERENHRKRSRIFRSWRFIAARSCCLDIYHFGAAMDGITTSLTFHTPTLKSLVDMQKCREAKKLFKKSFPHAEAMRHIVAHAAELTETKDMIKVNSSTGASFDKLVGKDSKSKIMIGASIINNTLVGSHKGQDRSCEISKDSHEKLIAVLTVFFSAFESAFVKFR
jgi:hypothetical protein